MAGGSRSFAGSGGAAVTGCERACAGESYCPADPAGRCRAVEEVEAVVAALEPRTQEWRPWKMRPSAAAAVNTVPAHHPRPREKRRTELPPPAELELVVAVLDWRDGVRRLGGAEVRIMGMVSP